MCKLRHWKAQGSKERTRSANLESPAWSTRSSKCLSRVIPWKWIKQDFLGWDWLVGMIGLNQEAKELLFRASFPLYSKFFLERTESTSPLELEDVSRMSGLGRAWETSYATLPALTEGETQPPKHWSHQDSTQSLGIWVEDSLCHNPQFRSIDERGHTCIWGVWGEEIRMIFP